MFVLLFLYRNAPEQDTATVIAQAWNVSKPLVTRSVDGLEKLPGSCSTACATRTTAVWCTCTCLMKDTLPPKRSIARCETFALTLQQGISEQEMQTLCSVMQKMQRNLNDLLERTKLT